MALVIASIIMMLIRIIGLYKKFEIGLDYKTIIYVVLLPVSAWMFYVNESIIYDIVGILVIGILFIFAARSLYYTYMVPGKSRKGL